MKKALKIAGISIGVLFLLLLLIPILFKDKIRAKVDEEISKNINAKVFYDPDQFGLSLIRNFPNFTLSIGDFGMVGKAEGFAGDTLMSVDQFRLVLDIMSVISGDKIKINKVYLKDPYILTRYKKDGKFSWDITFPDTSAQTSAPEDTSSAAFALNVEKWEIENGTIIYDDATMPVFARFENLNHTGSGDITADIYDIKTNTNIKKAFVNFDGITYLNNFMIDAKADMNINMLTSEYKFLENEFTLNNFKFGFDGLIAMPDTNITMNITFKAKENTFKNLISIVPGVFLQGYEDLKAEGNVAFDGYAKGTYNAVSMPGFGLNLQVNNAMMQYPQLPTAITDIIVDLGVDCKDGVIDHTNIDLKKFGMKLGNNPVSAEAIIHGLEPMDIQKCKANASVKLEEITQLFPIDSMQLKGLFTLALDAKGVYSDAQKSMPTVTANMGLSNGYVKYEGFAEALDKVFMDAAVTSNGDMKTSTAELKKFSMLLGQDAFAATAKVINFDDPNYDATLKGNINLEKINKLFPIEGTTMAGIIAADLQTKGVLSDVTAGNYGKTSTSGSMNISKLNYISTIDFPQGMTISEGAMNFSPEKITISKLLGTVGKSDMDITGAFSNYMGYMFGKGGDTTLHGTMNFNSKKFDVNEWMTEDSTATAETTAPAEEEGAVPVPKNIDFLMKSSIAEVLYDNMTLKNLKGDILVKNGIARMSNLNFQSLGGNFLMNGSYNTEDPAKPSFDFDMDIQNMVIKEAFKTFNTVQKLAPVAENMDGNISMKLDHLSAALGPDMMPLYATMNGAGNANIASAAIKDNKLLAGLATYTKANTNPLNIKDTKIKFKIEDGNIVVEPFDLNAGSTKMNIGGKNKLDGTIDYIVKLDVPAGSIGSAANSAISSLTGSAPSGDQNIKINLGVTGTNADPKFKVLGGGSGTSIKDAAKDKAKEEADRLKAEAEAKAKAEADRLKAEAEAKARAEADRLKKEAEAKAKAEADAAKKKALDEAKKKLKF
ncbi:MAG: outer membrane integrity protein [Cytophagaceae bacterium]|jgi:hypothetical protein|nr:outer membrane integrity protein [Cytophagaceae bacterium]